MTTPGPQRRMRSGSRDTLDSDGVAAFLRRAVPKITRRLTPAQATELRAVIGTRWARSAACATADPDAWFPTRGSAPVDEVFTVCAGCPVRRSCLATALLFAEDGIWAGTTPNHRRRAYRALRTGNPVDRVLDDTLAGVRAVRTRPRRRWSGRATRLPSRREAA